VTPPKLVLFDLDGTLIDSEIGIFASLDHAFAQIGVALPARDVLRTWIGPPFYQTFPSILGDDSELVETAIAHYRDHYVTTGWAGHRVYPGIGGLIETLGADDRKMAVVTTKVGVQARKIVASLAFGSAFANVYAADAKAMHSAKAEMIAQALADFGAVPDQAVMIGDRHFDIEGARANGVRAIGVTWGFGSADELRAAGAQELVHSALELGAALGIEAAAAV